jgi:hypothetical protein
VGEFGVIAEKTTPALRQRGGYTWDGRLHFPPLLPEMSHLPLLSRPSFPSPYQLLLDCLWRARFFSSQRVLTGFVSAAFFAAFIASPLAVSVFSVSGEMRLRVFIAALPRYPERGRMNL